MKQTTPKPEWTADTVMQITTDPRAVGVGGFPAILSDDEWIAANVATVRRMGTQRYLTGLLRNIKQIFGVDPESGDADWITANVASMQSKGAKQFLAALLADLRQAFGAAP